MSALRDALRDLPDTVFADLFESDEEYVLVVDLPGATAETTEVIAEDGHLSIEARREKATPTGFSYIREDRPIFLAADLPLPSDANGVAADADMERGVLEVLLPKRTDVGTKAIPIEDGERNDVTVTYNGDLAANDAHGGGTEGSDAAATDSDAAATDSDAAATDSDAAATDSDATGDIPDEERDDSTGNSDHTDANRGN